MTTIVQNPSCCGRARVVVVLIDDDIAVITEDEDAVLESGDIEADGATVVFQDPADTVDLEANHVDSLRQWAYARVSKDLKYYRAATADDPGVDEGEMILATTITDDPGTVDPGDERKIVRYATISVFYDDGMPFTVGEYTRADYPDYPESEVFPPDGTGTFEELPVGFLKKRYRGIAINNVLITSLCKALSPPALPEA
jgi:hypothetical protein